MSEAVIILQARMASTRLPGKALASIGARTLLGHCLARLRIGGAAPVLLATTTNQEDDVLVATAAEYGVAAFRGPADDVLSRFLLAARSVDARFVVRATGDNPAVDIGAPDRVLAALRSTKADHVIEDGLPYGAAVEGVTVDALVRASALAGRPGGPRTRDSVDPARPRPFRVRQIAGAGQRCDVLKSASRWIPTTTLSFMQSVAARMNNWSDEPELQHIVKVAVVGGGRGSMRMMDNCGL